MGERPNFNRLVVLTEPLLLKSRAKGPWHLDKGEPKNKMSNRTRESVCRHVDNVGARVLEDVRKVIERVFHYPSYWKTATRKAGFWDLRSRP